MGRRWGRIIVALATALAAWVVATPAFAAAPLCDDRGAIMFAPAPQLQSPETSIDVGDAPEDDCFGMAMLRTLYEGGAPSQLSAAPALQDVTLAAAIRIPGASCVRVGVSRDGIGRAMSGVLGQVDRPPRF